MRKFIWIVDSINEWIGKAVSFLMIPLVLITTYEVVMRYIIQKPTIWSWDLNIQIFAAIIMLGGGYTLSQKGHVMVDVLVVSMKPRRRAVLDIITSVFIFLGVGVMMINGWEMFRVSFQVREAMPTIWAPPYYTMKLMIPVGAFLVFIQALSELCKNILIVVSKEQKD